MAYKAAIFDLDGTLVHTMPEYRYLVVGEQTLKELGVTASEEDIDKFWFEARRDEIIRGLFGLDPEVFWKTYRKYDKAELRKKYTRLYNDVDFIQELRKKGCLTGIVTGAPIHIVSLETAMLGEENFNAIVIAQNSQGIIPKPHPHGLIECLNLLGIRNDEAIYVGNANEDIETARNARVFDVLLDRREYRLPKIQPSLTVHSLYELKDLFVD